MSETAQFAVLCAFTFLILVLVTSAVLINRWRRTCGTGSARFVTARASTNLGRKINSLVGPGVEIIMPCGHGLYPLTLHTWERRRLEQRVEQWLKAGANLTILITSPNDEALRYWQPLVNKLTPNLKVFFLDRDQATAEDAVEIQRLDQFHSVLIHKGGDPLGMWLEAIHEPRSKVAYNVEYVATNDIVDAQRERFFRILRVLNRLTDERRQSPHLKRIVPQPLRNRVDEVLAPLNHVFKTA